MCRMTDTGVRWKRTIELPEFGGVQRFLVVEYGGQQRYLRWPEGMSLENFLWVRPLYVVRVKARTI